MITKRTNKRPFVFLCTGMSLDGKISNHKKEQSEIAENDNIGFLYDMRIKADAVMVGGNTLLLDDPGLSVKTDERRQKRIASGKTEEPVKVGVISNADKIQLEGDFINKGTGKKIIFTTEQTATATIESLQPYAKVYVLGKEKVDLKKAMGILEEEGIKQLMVEGGGNLIASLLKDELVDEIYLKIGNLILGGRDTVTLVEGDGFAAPNIPKVEFYEIIKKPNYLVVRAIVKKN